MKTVSLGEGISFGGGARLVLIGGPCVIETEEHLLSLAGRVQEITSKLGIGYVLKSSFDKANRSSVDSYRGPGLERGLSILDRVKRKLALPVLTDVHEPHQVRAAAEVADILQIPAFLCRQTDLLVEAGRSGRPVNVKKGQFLSPEEMRNAIGKIEQTGNQQILLTERGTSFGYHNLIVDMRSLPILRGLGYPVIFDGTHSLQLPGGLGRSTGGQRQFIPHLVRAAAAVGIDGLFLEIHEAPERAPCDGSNMLPLAELGALLAQVQRIDRLLKEEAWTS